MYSSLNLNEYNVEQTSEFCAIYIPSMRTNVLTVYRSGNGDCDLFLVNFENVIAFLLNKADKLIILGDFNINFKIKSDSSYDIQNLLMSFGLEITINDYTRITSQSSSCIDNIMTNFSENIYRVGVFEPCFSDHRAQFISIDSDLKVVDTNQSLQRSITSSGLQKLKYALASTKMDFFYDTNNDPDVLMFFLTETYNNLILKFFPLKKVRQTAKITPVQWFNDELRSYRSNLSLIKHMADVTKDPDIFKLYKQQKYEYNRQLQNAKKSAYSGFITNSNNKPRDCWKILNFERGNTRSSSVQPDLSPDEINQFFITIAENIITSLPTINNDILFSYRNYPSPSKSFCFRPVVEDEISQIIKSLNNSNCKDVHEINSKILKETHQIVLTPFTHLINLILSTGVFPEALKYSKVLPIYKKGDSSKADNYRPISIVSTFGKVIEKVIKQQLYSYFESKSYFSNSQYGFRSARSTTNAVYNIVSEVIEGLERGNRIAISLCDLSKAFDCVSHDILLHKLNYYGVRGIPLKLISSYLCGRHQAVVSKGYLSDFRPVKHGVPQGSVLGPLLFIIYVNDLPHFISPYKSVQFADDTTYIISGNKNEDLKMAYEEVSDKSSTWFAANKLKLNTEKMQDLIISASGLHGDPDDKDTAKLLGITIDNRLNWSAHISQVKAKLSSSLFLIRQLARVVNFETLKVTYFSLFHSHLSYGLILWGNSTNALQIFRMQKKAIRILAGVSNLEHCRPLFIKLKIMPLPTLLIYQVLTEIHRKRSHLTKQSDVHVHNTRYSHYLRTNRSRLRLSDKNCLNYNYYNILPKDIKQLSCYSFKKVIKRYLLKHCFYCSEEYMTHCRTSTEMLTVTQNIFC
ncbi:uncharacterized protein LOC114345645 [Diabrotica virgifera virgifera]|uniref:Reverse transcriptase domain-containing protein n=1 Tax=Diabrotica virgifera virgifera TaxID=50390 RepID=A0ABM5KG76_DIAVI|nr:uncharacterized protein LOC114345645 [Diabrotica virgifera virgifera]XP_050509199.1 uncharacterized protein LOC114345645 [Diabrotica virgifera virgifera]